MKSFVILRSYFDAIDPLPDEYRLAMYDAIMRYEFEKKEPDELDPILKSLFTLIKPTIDSADKRYAAAVKNGKKGGRPKTQSKPKENPTETETKANYEANPNLDIDIDIDKDMDMDKE